MAADQHVKARSIPRTHMRSIPMIHTHDPYHFRGYDPYPRSIPMIHTSVIATTFWRGPGQDPFEEVRNKTLDDNSSFQTSGSPRNDPYPFFDPYRTHIVILDALCIQFSVSTTFQMSNCCTRLHPIAAAETCKAFSLGDGVGLFAYVRRNQSFLCLPVLHFTCDERATAKNASTDQHLAWLQHATTLFPAAADHNDRFSQSMSWRLVCIL